MATLLILYVIFGTLLVILSIPLLQNKIKPNGLYGFRVKTTLDDPKMWYAVNHHFAKRLLIIGLALIIGSIGLYFVPGITLDQYAIGVLIILVLFFGVGLFQSVRYMYRLKETKS